MVQFLVDKINAGDLPFEAETVKFIDLGTGNGHLLFQLYDDLEEECDVQTEFKGIDYSPDSVLFAEDILEKKYLGDVRFTFEQVDLLLKKSSFLEKHAGKFDILLDKGTLDAIALNQDPLADFDGKIGMEIYADQVVQLMHKNSVLLITSCNFTEEELVKIITGNEKNGLRVWEKIKYPSFKFGGVTGSTICSIAFTKA